MNGVVFAAARNREGRHDATGAFIPGAHLFARKYGLDVTLIDETIGTHKAAARDAVLQTISAASRLDVIAYFGHGTVNSLPSAGIHESDIAGLVQAINRTAAGNCKVVLYACLAGHPGGFAQKLSAQLKPGITVLGHTVEGHAYQNPCVARYPQAPGDKTPFLVAPHSPLWKVWNQELHSGSSLWMEYPFLSAEQIERRLAPPPKLVFGRGQCWSGY